jgi:4-hydroxy-tetrahydrodipicolinate synthase
MSMPVQYQPRGLQTALVTPFTLDGALDVPTFRALVAFQAAARVPAVVPCGTTGESPTLEWDEHRALIEEASVAADGRMAILAGTGSNNTAEAIVATREAKRSGASAALLVDCYYNGPSSLELRTEYYERILAAVPDLPIVPYVIPGRTGCALSAEDLALLHLTDPVRVPAVKEASGDLERMRRTRMLAGEGLAILSGDDDLTLRAMRDPQIDAAGVVSVMANVVPGALVELVDAQQQGRTDHAERMSHALQPLLRLVTVEVAGERTLPNGQRAPVTERFRSPLSIKTMMAGLGMLTMALRAPLGRMTAAGVARCRAALREAHQREPSLFAPIEATFSVSVAERLANDGVWASLAR